MYFVPPAALPLGVDGDTVVVGVMVGAYYRTLDQGERIVVFRYISPLLPLLFGGLGYRTLARSVRALVFFSLPLGVDLIRLLASMWPALVTRSTGPGHGQDLE